MVTPKGASYWPGSFTWPDTENMPQPLERSVPMDAYHSAELRNTIATSETVSTLFTTVGRA